MKKILIILASLFVFIVAVSALVALFSTDGISLSEKVALVYIIGPLIDSRDSVEEIRDYVKDPSIKAIVLRIDSPGGGVAASQEIFGEVRKAALEKKVVASMGSVAASGGYYVSAPATMIMANPGTITGSIGVIMEIPNIEALMDKVGIKTEVIKSGKHKDIASASRKMTEEDRRLLQGLIDDVYEQFVEDVAESRGIPIEDVRKLADGRIFTGRQAVKMGLVDRLGGLEDAIKLSAELAGIKGEPHVVTKEEEFSIFEMLEGKLSGKIPEFFPSIRLKYILTP